MPAKKIDITKQAKDFLTTLPPKQFKQNLITILKLSQEPLPQDAKKLRGFTDLYRVDIGEYRIVYRFNAEILYIMLAGKRNDDEVYTMLRRSGLK